MHTYAYLMRIRQRPVTGASPRPGAVPQVVQDAVRRALVEFLDL